MEIIRDSLQLCEDCTIAAVNGDFTAIDSDERVAEIVAGLDRLGRGLVCSGDTDEFSWHPCDSCKSNLGGSRTEFAILS